MNYQNCPQASHFVVVFNRCILHLHLNHIFRLKITFLSFQTISHMCDRNSAPGWAGFSSKTHPGSDRKTINNNVLAITSFLTEQPGIKLRHWSWLINWWRYNKYFSLHYTLPKGGTKYHDVSLVCALFLLSVKHSHENVNDIGVAGHRYKHKSNAFTIFSRIDATNLIITKTVSLFHETRKLFRKGRTCGLRGWLISNKRVFYRVVPAFGLLHS